MYLIGCRRMNSPTDPFQMGGSTAEYTEAEIAIAAANRMANNHAGAYEFVVLECATIHTISVEKPVKVKKDVIVFD